jgi:hypothetical protein
VDFTESDVCELNEDVGEEETILENTEFMDREELAAEDAGVFTGGDDDEEICETDALEGDVLVKGVAALTPDICHADV